MSEETVNPSISYVVRVSSGRSGHDQNAPDWEVCELENGVVMDTADIYDNLTLTEATQMADMWTKKKEEAEG